MKMLALVFFLAACQQVLENRIHGGMSGAIGDAGPNRCHRLAFFERKLTF